MYYFFHYIFLIIQQQQQHSSLFFLSLLITLYLVVIYTSKYYYYFLFFLLLLIIICMFDPLLCENVSCLSLQQRKEPLFYFQMNYLFDLAVFILFPPRPRQVVLYCFLLCMCSSSLW